MKTIIGEYGSFADSLISRLPGTLSFRNPLNSKLQTWKERAATGVLDLLAVPDIGSLADIKVKCRNSYEWDGLYVEELCWQLPFGPETEAIFLKPAGSTGRLPGILGLHDHAAKKYWGYRKIARGKDNQPPLVEKHQTEYYSGLSWANEIAKQGFAVLVHDTFPFASRRVRIADVSENVRRGASVADPVADDEIEAYNHWASDHEHDMAKSLFSAGTTWPGVTFGEDKIALDILAAREDVDSSRLGCGGLSGGGMRTAFLGGLDSRIKCAVCAGFMTTWRDFSLYSAWTHTWMLYVPGLPVKLDFPEILGLRVPLPTMILNNNSDFLFTLEGMQDADIILKEVYKKADAEEKYKCSFYPGDHKFDAEMQKEAFSWFKKWL